MNKINLKSLAMWLVIGIVGVAAVGGIAMAMTGSFPIGIESCNNCAFTVQGGTSGSAGNDVFGASGTRLPHGLSADTTSPVTGEVRGTTLTVTGASTVGSITVGSSGTSMDLIASTATTTIDFAAITAGTCAEKTFTLTGASAGDPVALSVSSTVTGSTASWMAYVKSADTVAIVGCNVSSTASTADFAVSPFRATVFSF